MKFETKAIRLQSKQTQYREHSTPVFPTSSFTFDDVAQMQNVFAGEEKGNIYSRFSNPSVHEFETKIAALEEVERCMATATGMAAVFAGFLAFLKSGDHILATRAVFGSTFQVLSQTLKDYNITCTFVDATNAGSWQLKHLLIQAWQ